MKQREEESNDLVIGYMALRRWVGLLGAALPFALWLGAAYFFKAGLQPSMSSYYYTGMRDFFVGVLCAIGVFMFTYKGYEPKDDVAGDIAGGSAILLALFPTTASGNVLLLDRIGLLHLAFATVFFLTLAYFSVLLFTKTDPTKTPTRRKLQRNNVYRVCGTILVASIALIALVTFVAAIKNVVGPYNPVFWLEAIGVVAFGVSWLTKGEAMLGDEK